MRYELFTRAIDGSGHLVVLGTSLSEEAILETHEKLVLLLANAFYPQPETCEVGIRRVQSTGITYSAWIEHSPAGKKIVWG